MSWPGGLADLFVLFYVPLVFSWVLTDLLIRWAPRLGLVDYPSERKVHVQPTPRGGGLAIFSAVLFLGYYLSALNYQTLLGTIILLLGLLDDLSPLPWPIRLIVQFAVALAAVFLCLPPCPWFVRAAAVVWIAGLINAFNMLDNMDALSGGVGWIAAGFLAVLSWLGAPETIAEWGMFVVMMGALSGFLCFNRPPARIFMGDAGSTFLGFTIGLGSVRVMLVGDGTPWSWLVPPCILAVPCYDLLSVVLLRLSQGRSPFHADKQHLSHRLADGGLSNWTAVHVIYLLALASGTSGVILYVVRDGMIAALIVGQLAVWWLALAVMEFATKEHRHDTQAQNNGKPSP
ncbi:MAG TPA: MraY family glycosyltransferase [Gemmataceae bacterium]|jgi:UDP-GlcNAc:undecaprenyl-phosphate GlcNAc-1-phosphate transferase